ncbi:MAG TPA: carboxypeptidase regulatory-like domain-containing protein [Vicinamibacterales bacterium]|nr:carboxypeptidase regulatory-like domain-containing protein [Vicinamibacterales bacterium]
MHGARFAIAASLLAVAFTACGGSEPAPQPTTAPPGAQRVDAATAGTVSGRVVFQGEPPENPVARISGDPVCQRENSGGYRFENYIVRDGGLDNVFVYVKDGLGNYYFDVPAEPVKLDQQGCRYVPHVLGVRVGQPIEISNSDATLHNVHAVPNVNREFNFGQHIKGMKDLRTFTAPEVMVPFKCDVHGWMNAYVGVVEHPYFAVTSDGGRFELKGLPPGTYTVEAWHEKAGTQTQPVTIGEKESKEITFTFTAQAPAN